MNAKERHRNKLLEYLGNPENKFLTRADLATEILGFKNRQTLHNNFTADELSKIESEALEIRRKKYAPRLSMVDIAMLKEAEAGNDRAAKLCYQRFEGWSPTTTTALTGPDGKPLNHPVARAELIHEILAEVSGATLGLPKPVHQPKEDS